MARLNLLLLIAVLGSAVYLVHTQYLSRQLFTELHRIELEARRLELDRDRLQVEKLAKEQLKMRTTTPAITQYVRQDGTVIPAVVAPAPAAPAGRAAPSRGAR